MPGRPGRALCGSSPFGTAGNGTALRMAGRRPGWPAIAGCVLALGLWCYFLALGGGFGFGLASDSPSSSISAAMRAAASALSACRAIAW